MILASGARLGTYEIQTLIGAGGMGDVYRAKDTKLGRDVALKILPTTFTTDAERIARFRREAQVLASLNHPHIAQIHGMEEANGTQFLVLELVDGESLDKRISRGPIAVDEALDIAKQIAEALEAAHEKGIIHRDLKPGNVALTKDGQVKVLDFGLAKAVENPGGSVDAMNSPTITSPAMMTGLGAILGTAAYMSPEQAKGKPADKRSDIWAFGCVLYEMLAGNRAFEGDDISTTLAAVLKSDPEWSVLTPAPASLRRMLIRCLRKDPRSRLQAIGDARVEIGDLVDGARESDTVTPIVRAGPLQRLAVPLMALLVGSLVTGVVVRLATRSTVAPRVWRFQIVPPSAAALTISGLTRDIAVTPDGSRLIYVGANGTTLFVRSLDQLESTPLVRGGALRDPFVSPDGQWVGFFDGPQTLKKVALTGGPAVVVSRVDSFEKGATWAPDGNIILAAAGSNGLQRVSSDGGVPTVLTRPDRARGEAYHSWPEMLPDGHAVLYTVTTTTGESDTIDVFDLQSGKTTVLIRGGSFAQYVLTGYLVYATAGTLRAVGFDAKRRLVLGPSREVMPQVLTTSLGAAEATVAREGTLVYLSGSAGSGAARSLVWVDRQSRETPITAPPRPYAFPRLSPDGQRIAITSFDQNTDIRLWDLGHSTLTRMTSDPAIDTNAVWSPDGRRMLFGSNRFGSFNIFNSAPDGTGAPERLTESSNLQLPTAVSPDGTRLIFSEWSPATNTDVMVLELNGAHRAVPLVRTPFDERNGIVSPDGRWLAYEANETGSFEVYVCKYPDGPNGGRWQVSPSGGTQPLWTRDGHELFYIAPDGAMMRITVAGGGAWTAGTATKVFDGRYIVSTAGNWPRNYDISPDGQRFLMLKAAGLDVSGTSQLVVVQHFDEELRVRLPTK